MGNTLKKVQQNGFINWQHRAIIPGNKEATDRGIWISYEQSVSQELERAIQEESDEPVYTIQNSAAYNEDQILFNGDIATRLGGPFIHRTQEKRLKQLKRTAYGFFINADKAAGDFTTAGQPVANQCPDKAILLNSASCQLIFKQLYILINRDFQVEENASPKEAFVKLTDAEVAQYKLKTAKSTVALNEFYQLQVVDEKNNAHTIIVQRYEFDFSTVENVIAADLHQTDSKLAALLTDEARISLAMDAMSRILCTTGNAVFTRVEVDIDTTASRAK